MDSHLFLSDKAFPYIQGVETNANLAIDYSFVKGGVMLKSGNEEFY